jgi:hypothetical protein
VRRSKGEPATVTLEADYAPPTGPQAAAIADALGLSGIRAADTSQRRGGQEFLFCVAGTRESE